MSVGIQVKINSVFCKGLLWHNVCVIETDMSSGDNHNKIEPKSVQKSGDLCFYP